MKQTDLQSPVENTDRDKVTCAKGTAYQDETYHSPGTLRKGTTAKLQQEERPTAIKVTG